MVDNESNCQWNGAENGRVADSAEGIEAFKYTPTLKVTTEIVYVHDKHKEV